MTQTILYARVSTAEQTLEHQEKQARDNGFEIDLVVADHGVSGINVPLRERSEGKRLFDILRQGDTLVVRWVDRLGRNYSDVTAVMQELIAKGVIIRTVINNMVFDGATQDPMQKAIRDAMISFMAAMAEANAAALKSAQQAGIKNAKEVRSKYRGRKPSYNRAQLEDVLAQLDKGIGDSEVARIVGLSRATVIRIKNDRAKAFEALEMWE